jgi:hypothetical protein
MSRNISRSEKKTAYRDLGAVDIVFVDGYHSEEQVRYDFEAFRARLTPSGLMLFHDGIYAMTSPIYGADRKYEHRVNSTYGRATAGYRASICHTRRE